MLNITVPDGFLVVEKTVWNTGFECPYDHISGFDLGIASSVKRKTTSHTVILRCKYTVQNTLRTDLRHR
jgi:hypothetical protein